MKTGTTTLPLHWGKAPPWLFQRMKRLAREIILIMLRDYGAAALMKRLSDPFWFQALGCALGFDWHSSGLTTTLCGALKEASRGMEAETGFFVTGGKGGTSRKTPDEIMGYGPHIKVDPEKLVYASRMSAKVDSAGVQDGYQLYHHAFFFDRSGNWCVVQQGLNYDSRYARRYHWLGGSSLDFVCDPHAAVCCDARASVLNLVAAEGAQNRGDTTELASEHPDRIIAEFNKASSLDLPQRHRVLKQDLDSRRLYTTLISTYERQPRNFEELMSLRGVGPKTMRALALLSELVYGHAPSFRDPARFSYALGGKDGHPYPVDRRAYDESIEFLGGVVNQSRLGALDKQRAFRQLAALVRGKAGGGR